LRTDADRGQFIPIELLAHPEAEEGARFWVAFTAVGITDDVTEGSTLSIANQARGVVALWLATRGADAGTAAKMTSFDDDPGQSGSYDRPWPGTCYAGPAPVVWALNDLEAARVLIAAPEAQVTTLLHDQWDRFTDRATSTDELLAAAGLELASPRGGVTRGSQAC
ncbi:MAG: hypothetical protein ACRDZU_13480, partial [Acidimicrobiales bacterium]